MAAWLAARGVALKAESDGRMFPVTDDAGTIVGCLQRAAKAAGVLVRTRCGVQAARPGFEVGLTTGETVACARLLIATGGGKAGGRKPRIVTGTDFGKGMVLRCPWCNVAAHLYLPPMLSGWSLTMLPTA